MSGSFTVTGQGDGQSASATFQIATPPAAKLATSVTTDQSVYHAGDTAYFSGFREIGRRLSPDLALLPIGAYNPPSFRNVHASPADATRAFLDLNARWMVPMHYGTFRLSHEPMDEPLQLLEKEAEAAGVRDRVLVLQEGVTQFF